MFRGFAQHYFRAIAQRKFRDSGANGGKRDARQFFLGRDAQRMRRGAANGLRGGRSAELHAGRVNYVARF